MRIGIDISQLAFPGTGVATYTRNLVENLLRIDKENEYILFYSSLRKDIKNAGLKIGEKHVELKNYKLPPLFLEFIWNRLHILPIEEFTGHLDIFHTSDWLEPPAKCPKVTTVHDLAIFKYPETFSPKGGHNIVSNLRRKLAWVKRESRVIIAVSENTKKDIVKILDIPSEKIKVIYEAGDEVFRKKSSLRSIENAKKKYGISGNYILAVGTLEPRKNLKRLIMAFSRVRRNSSLSLAIAGNAGWGGELEGLQGKTLGVKFLGYVPKEVLAPLYAGAQCFVYPSLYEGFGLPILEAMASGCPVVTSNISSLPEVAGEAAVLVDPENIEDIARGIKEAISKRKELIRKGFERARQFSWEKTASQTLGVYREVTSVY